MANIILTEKDLMGRNDVARVTSFSFLNNLEQKKSRSQMSVTRVAKTFWGGFCIFIQLEKKILVASSELQGDRLIPETKQTDKRRLGKKKKRN